MRALVCAVCVMVGSLVATPAAAASGITGEENIHFIAGNGSLGSTGDGGPALVAGISPNRLAFDGDGNLYVSEASNHVVRKIDRNGVITRLAGTGTVGFGGDGGPAVSAALNIPLGLAVDAAGNVYIADSGNHRIRKVDAQTGRIDTIAGGGSGGGCSAGQAICNGDGGPARQAGLNSPHGVAVAADGTVYIADSANHRVRKIDAAGTMQPVAGYGSQGLGDEGPARQSTLSLPTDVLVDAGGNVYVADLGHGRVRWIDTSQVIYTYAGGGAMLPTWAGTPPAQTVFAPYSLARDADGNLYIGDSGDSHHYVLKIDLARTVITAVIGNGGAGANTNGEVAHTAALGSWPVGVAADRPGAVYVADTNNRHVFKVAPNLADLSVRKIAVEQSVTVGRPLHYGVEFVNNGPANATNVAVTDIPQGMGQAQASGQGVVCGGTAIITCTPAGPLPPMQPKRFVVTATPDAVGQYCNTATVQADQPDPVPGNNVSAGPVCVPVLRQFALGEFVVFGVQRVGLGGQMTVVSGSVGTNRRQPGTETELRLLGVTVLDASSTVIADTVELVDTAAREVRGNQIVQQGTTTVASQGLPGSFPLLTLPPLPTFNPGTQPSDDVTVPAGASRTLPPGRYRNVTVGGGATLTLPGWLNVSETLVTPGGPVPATYYDFASLNMGNSARMVFTQPPGNVLASRIIIGMNVRVRDRIKAGTGVTIGLAAAGPLNGSHIVLYVGGTDIPGLQPQNALLAVSIGARSRVRANIYAPNGSVSLNFLTEGVGAFIGKQVGGNIQRLVLESAFR
jgi:uncharacterized repeat protein (TIGR01451 family)